jgi:hypothetical protein
MSKMGSHDPFGYLKHKLWPKKGSKIKLQIWLPTIKSQESPWITYVKVAWHITLESSRWGLQFFFRPHLNQKFAKRVMGFQSYESPNSGTLETKWHLGVAPVARHREYYKGEGGGFPQVWAMVSLVSSCMLVICPCTKSAQTMH